MDPLPAPNQSRGWATGTMDSPPGFAPPCTKHTRVLHPSSVRGMSFHTLPFQAPNYLINLSVFTFPARSHSFTAVFSWVRTQFAAVHILRIITQIYVTCWRSNAPTICKKVICWMACTEQEPQTTSWALSLSSHPRYQMIHRQKYTLGGSVLPHLWSSIQIWNLFS